MDKILEAQKILEDLGLPIHNKVAALSFLALCGIKPNDKWSDAKKSSLTLTKGIMEFANSVYNQTYKPNSRESFRNDALNPFIRNRIINLNPDNPNLAPQSSKTHYAIKPLVINTISHFETDQWDQALEDFKFEQYEENKKEGSLIKNLQISNYKSIEKIDIELGRFNVFIGANGSGKSNILEAIAMIAASKGNDLDLEGLISRGVRVAKPTLTFSSFLGKTSKKEILIQLSYLIKSDIKELKSAFKSTDIDDIYAKWIDSESDKNTINDTISMIESLLESDDAISASELIEKLKTKNNSISNDTEEKKLNEDISEFSIFNLNTQTLRGLNSSSRKLPLGINGEGLDILINNLNNHEVSKLRKCNLFFSWLDEVTVDKKDNLKNSGYKLGKSNSTLYFSDKFMQKQNNLFSAENANEGILHVLFYLALFISNKTPKFFAIDNIETALNPKLCRTLIKELTILAEEFKKQVIITTHNPAILDGLNLNDDSQRLFEIYRNDEGATKVRRIKFKKDLSDKTSKLSTMWTSGLLGAVPNQF